MQRIRGRGVYKVGCKKDGKDDDWIEPGVPEGYVFPSSKGRADFSSFRTPRRFALTGPLTEGSVISRHYV